MPTPLKVEKEIIPCSRVAACGAIFHKSCLKGNTSQGVWDGCIKCKSETQFSTKFREGGVANNPYGNRKSAFDDNCNDQCSPLNEGLSDLAKRSAPLIVLDSDDEKK